MATTLPTRKPTNVQQQTPVLSVRDLEVTFRVEGGHAKAVNGVSFDLFPEEVLGIVGESGSGKSVTSLSIMRLIPDPPGNIAAGSIAFDNRDLLKLSYEEMRDIRGSRIAMIFQDTLAHLNPVYSVGWQIAETFRAHNQCPPKEAEIRAVELLRRVGIPDPGLRAGQYPQIGRAHV